MGGRRERILKRIKRWKRHIRFHRLATINENIRWFGIASGDNGNDVGFDEAGPTE